MSVSVDLLSIQKTPYTSPIQSLWSPRDRRTHEWLGNGDTDRGLLLRKLSRFRALATRSVPPEPLSTSLRSKNSEVCRAEARSVADRSVILSRDESILVDLTLHSAIGGLSVSVSRERKGGDKIPTKSVTGKELQSL